MKGALIVVAVGVLMALVIGWIAASGGMPQEDRGPDRAPISVAASTATVAPADALPPSAPIARPVEWPVAPPAHAADASRDPVAQMVKTNVIPDDVKGYYRVVMESGRMTIAQVADGFDTREMEPKFRSTGDSLWVFGGPSSSHFGITDGELRTGYRWNRAPVIEADGHGSVTLYVGIGVPRFPPDYIIGIKRISQPGTGGDGAQGAYLGLFVDARRDEARFYRLVKVSEERVSELKEAQKARMDEASARFKEANARLPPGIDMTRRYSDRN